MSLRRYIVSVSEIYISKTYIYTERERGISCIHHYLCSFFLYVCLFVCLSVDSRRKKTLLLPMTVCLSFCSLCSVFFLSVLTSSSSSSSLVPSLLRHLYISLSFFLGLQHWEKKKRKGEEEDAERNRKSGSTRLSPSLHRGGGEEEEATPQTKMIQQ